MSVGAHERRTHLEYINARNDKLLGNVSPLRITFGWLLLRTLGISDYLIVHNARCCESRYWIDIENFLVDWVNGRSTFSHKVDISNLMHIKTFSELIFIVLKCSAKIFRYIMRFSGKRHGSEQSIFPANYAVKELYII